jgi:hypothetical protein
MRRCLAALIGLLLLAGCSKGGDRTRRSATPSPSVGTSAGASESPSVPVTVGTSTIPGATASHPPSAAAPARGSPSPTRAPAARVPASPSPTRAPAALPPGPPPPTRAPTAGPVPSAPPSSPTARPPVATGDQVRQPAPGAYVYALAGTSKGLSGTEEPYPAGATQTVQVSPGTAVTGGTEYQTVTTSAPGPSVQITARNRWEPGRVVLVSTVIQVPLLGSYACTYTPPPETLRLPPVTRKFPKQSFSSADCSGTVEVAVSGPENVTTPERTWRTWKVYSHSTFTMGNGALTGTIDTTSWLAPDLGEAVQGQTSIQANPGGTTVGSTQSTILSSHP